MAKTKSVTSGDGKDNYIGDGNDKVNYIRGWQRQSQLHPGMAKTKSIISGDGMVMQIFLQEKERPNEQAGTGE